MIDGRYCFILNCVGNKRSRDYFGIRNISKFDEIEGSIAICSCGKPIMQQAVVYFNWAEFNMN